MPIRFDDALGTHAQALVMRSKRAQVLAANLVNADTPNYLARDLDFPGALAQAGGSMPLSVTHAAHIQGGSGSGAELLYRVPTQPAVDGNTVDPHQEKAQFMQNALRYEASLEFLDARIKGLMAAIRGE